MRSFTRLEPLSTGDLIDRAVRLYRRNFTPLVSIAAVPTVIGYIVSLMFWNGYTGLLTGVSGSRGLSMSSITMLLLGALGYPVWFYTLLVTISGLSRVVGDHLMLDEPISVRRCFGAAKQRLGAITLMALLFVVMLFAAYIVLSIVLFILMMGIGLLVGVVAAVRLPQWIITTLLVITVIVGVALALVVICVILSRVVFLPAIVMIEGQSAGNAVGRSINLGKGNWFRVGAIVLFTYFVSLSLLAALAMPVGIILYQSNLLNADAITSPTVSILYTSLNQLSTLLCLPIWIVSFTLLYFDSRVRKEAYDLDLIAREINPGFFWQPPVAPPPLGYPPPSQTGWVRTPVQTSPLGLAGYTSPQSRVESRSSEVGLPAAESLSAEFRNEPNVLNSSSGLNETEEPRVRRCAVCDAHLVPGASFCMNCGTLTTPQTSRE
ncbi:MAG TPA: hypothetical protein VKN18_26270 [Blastocatellia bacterium]|nr:hypothetical protein [Blastocatellia bacterium]